LKAAIQAAANWLRRIPPVRAVLQRARRGEDIGTIRLCRELLGWMLSRPVLGDVGWGYA